jgi:mono/diheme cytochrome c family protein
MHRAERVSRSTAPAIALPDVVMRLRRTVRASLLAAGFVLAPALAAPAGEPVSPQQAEFFEKHVRPVLIANCLTCHGPEKQEAALRLDSRAAMLKGSENGPVVVPGKPEVSKLIAAIGYQGDVQMPPPGKLPPPAIDALTQWVRMGLPWPVAGAAAGDGRSHWAFRPLAREPLPEVRDAAWPQMPMDYLILAKLEAAGLKPSAPADRRTLLRRVTFDLHGLPPAPEEIAAFEQDAAPGAYERVVERLLASPRYGERWGRYWLDVARYADNKGYVFFEDEKYPWAYAYRDYVIRSFNEDRPYDEFIRQQLAADQLDRRGPTRDLAALGFLTLGAHFMNNTDDIMDDRIDVVSRGLLGMTVGCARCHDHKYEPIKQADYYALYGVFRSSAEPLLGPLLEPLPDTDEARKFSAEMAAREAKLKEFTDRKFDELVSGARTRAAEYLLAAHAEKDQPSAEDFMLLVEEGDLNPTMIVRWWVLLDQTRRKHDPVWAPWHALAALPEAEFAARAPSVCAELAAANDPHRPYNHLVVQALVDPPPASMKEVAERYSKLLNRVEALWQETLTAAAGSGQVPDRLPNDAEEELRKVFHGPEAPPDLPPAFGYGLLTLLPDRPSQEKLKSLLKEVETWSTTGPGAPARAMALYDLDPPYNPRVFVRGNPNRLGPHVPRRFLEVLGGAARPFERGSGRLDLAQEITSRDNPLTARVMANRVWALHFGQGIVRTLGDFGVRGDPPTHPELLDYLAGRFIDSGWSIKELHREMLLSAAYRQASNGAGEDAPSAGQEPADEVFRKALAIDPENRLLWRMNRRRLDFEATRDTLLAVANALDEQIGGPPVQIFSGFVGRRTVYGFVDRMNLPNLWRAFDFPNPTTSSPQRESTTIAPQALFFLNHSLAAECAERVLARPDVNAAPDDAARLAQIYEILFGRLPTDADQALARTFLGDQPSPQRWGQLVHALLLTNELAFVD